MIWKTRVKITAMIAAGFALLSLALVLTYALVYNVYEFGGVTTMAVRPVDVVRLGQGWNEHQTRTYHHYSQGTKILPLSWFRALEQPILSPLPAGMYGTRDYLTRFGFLYDDGKTESADELPIGFAVENDFIAPYATPPIETKTAVVGLTCAACHTGRLDVTGRDGRLKGVLIEGGSAMIHITSFQTATGLALGYTDFIPQRFNRFAARVLKADLSDNDPRKVRLRRDLKTLIATGQAAKDYAKDHKLNPVEPGYSRTDALALIGNRVFGILGPENQVVTDAPVNYPHLWDTAWFDWVQYNASIRMPMARNIGEALGVGALVNLDPNKGKLFESTVNVEGLAWMEALLGGSNPFEGLQPPRWDPALLGEINPSSAAKGETLYRAHCVGCHLPPRNELKADFASATPKYFRDESWSGKRILSVPTVDVYEVGTDPNHVLNFYRRVAVMTRLSDDKDAPPGPVTRETISARVGLFLITSLIRRAKYEELGLLAPGKSDTVKDEKRLKEYDRYRTLPDALVVGDQHTILKQIDINSVILAPLRYKARPLDGVWATPPFFHNGSVPTLYQVLLPVARRDASFYLGSKRFDTKHVGYETHQVVGASLMDTSLSGNHNTGHEFRNMTLDELEQAQGASPDAATSQEARWARVLGLEPAGLARLSAAERQGRERQASLDARKLPRYVPARGVLGVEFTDEERWQLVEYLKTL